ncbi:hypothetical protein E2P65_03575 [Candidatus Bathyarchaeota archaeon]|nr:hypothetical protein E2P65_03575 [Candidatus Bathyarchaeota archaeon]
MSLDTWQGVEQEFAAGAEPIGLFEALGGKGVFLVRPEDNIPRALLRNSGVCYIHSNLFEVSSPECRDPLELLAYDKANEAYARLASWALEEKTGARVHLYKTNIASDPKGEAEYTTVGSHENYLVKRAGFESRMHILLPYLVLRQVLFGAGGYVRGEYWISPRTIFPKTLCSETSTDYPIVSTRDEPHAEESYFRVHVVYGEGARSEYTTFLKHSLTTYVLLAIQDGHIRDVPEIEDPIDQGQEIAMNLEGDWSVKLADGGQTGVTDYLNAHYLDGVERLFADRQPSDQDRRALRELKLCLDKLDQGLLEDLNTSIEWLIKLGLIERGFHQNFQVEEGLDEKTAKETAVYQYSAVTDPLFDSLVKEHGIKTVISEGDVERAFMEPPVESRGEFRVAAARRLKGSLSSVSWSNIKLRKGYRRLQYDFLELDGWNPEEIEARIREAQDLLEKY